MATRSRRHCTSHRLAATKQCVHPPRSSGRMSRQNSQKFQAASTGTQTSRSSVHIFLADRMSMSSRWRRERICPFSAQEFLVHRDEMLHVGSVRSDIETPRLLNIDCSSLVIRSCCSRCSDQEATSISNLKKWHSERSSSRRQLKAPFRKCIKRTARISSRNRLAVHRIDLKIDRDRHRAVLGMWRMKHGMIVSRGRGRIEIQLSGKIDRKRKCERQARQAATPQPPAG